MLDSLNLFQTAVESPGQITQAIQNLQLTAELPQNFSSAVVLGMGGSGISGDLLKAASEEKSGIPIFVSKQYELPEFVDEKTLVFAVSFSGNTKETLMATKAALEKKAGVVAITTGGDLHKLAEENNLPTALLDKSLPMPRAGLFAMAGTVLALAEDLGIYPNARKELLAAAEHLQGRAGEFSAENSEPRLVAKDLGRCIPLILGSSIGAVAACRWKTQINENAKSPAFWSDVPEFCHNELAGWGQNGDVTRQVFCILQLRSDYEHSDIESVFNVVAEMLDEVVNKTIEVKAMGRNKLTQLLDLMLFGDFVSLYMAEEFNTDPGPIPAIAELKKRLGK